MTDQFTAFDDLRDLKILQSMRDGGTGVIYFQHYMFKFENETMYIFGTNDMQDMKTNLSIAPYDLLIPQMSEDGAFIPSDYPDFCEVHGGYWHDATELFFHALWYHGDEYAKVKRFAGHSAGGPLASLLSIMGKGRLKAYAAVSFSAPAFADSKAFATMLGHVRHYRLTYDIVPKIHQLLKIIYRFKKAEYVTPPSSIALSVPANFLERVLLRIKDGHNFKHLIQALEAYAYKQHGLLL